MTRRALHRPSSLALGPHGIRYEAAQTPFHRTRFPSPALVFNVLLSSDARLNIIHDYHRATGLNTAAADLLTLISGTESDLAKHVPLLSALEEKLAVCKRDQDKLGIAFWADRVNEKKGIIEEAKADLLVCQAELASVTRDLEAEGPIAGLNLRKYAAKTQAEEIMRVQDTHDELFSWKVGNHVDDAHLFPPLETILPPAPAPHYGPFTHHHRRHHGRAAHMPQRRFTEGPGLRNFVDRVTDVVSNPATATSLVPTQEIKSMLDTFLANLSNQLAGTFNDSRVSHAEDIEPRLPGAFVSTDAQTQVPTEEKLEHVSTQTQAPAEVKVEKPVKPSSKLGKGGYRHKHISCDGCLTGIRGMRYKCEVSTVI